MFDGANFQLTWEVLDDQNFSSSRCLVREGSVTPLPAWVVVYLASHLCHCSFFFFSLLFILFIIITVHSVLFVDFQIVFIVNFKQKIMAMNINYFSYGTLTWFSCNVNNDCFCVNNAALQIPLGSFMCGTL